jgi:hypothetical protein
MGETSARRVDMSRSYALTAALQSILSQNCTQPDTISSLSRTRYAAKSRFSWEVLIPQYVEMYRRVTET